MTGDGMSNAFLPRSQNKSIDIYVNSWCDVLAFCVRAGIGELPRGARGHLLRKRHSAGEGFHNTGLCQRRALRQRTSRRARRLGLAKGVLDSWGVSVPKLFVHRVLSQNDGVPTILSI